MMKSTRFCQPAQKGAAAVEFALVLPLLLMVVFGIIEFSLMLYDKAVITNASREAARAGIVFRTPKLTTAQIQSVAINYSQANLISLSGPSTSQTNPTVSVSQASPPDFGTPLNVTVTYTYTGLGLGSLLSVLTGPRQLVATTVMNNE